MKIKQSKLVDFGMITLDEWKPLTNREMCDLLGVRQNDEYVQYSGGKGESPIIGEANPAFMNDKKPIFSDFRFVEGKLYRKRKQDKRH